METTERQVASMPHKRSMSRDVERSRRKSVDRAQSDRKRGRKTTDRGESAHRRPSKLAEHAMTKEEEQEVAIEDEEHDLETTVNDLDAETSVDQADTTAERPPLHTEQPLAEATTHTACASPPITWLPAELMLAILARCDLRSWLRFSEVSHWARHHAFNPALWDSLTLRYPFACARRGVRSLQDCESVLAALLRRSTRLRSLVIHLRWGTPQSLEYIQQVDQLTVVRSTLHPPPFLRSSAARLYLRHLCLINARHLQHLDVLPVLFPNLRVLELTHVPVRLPFSRWLPLFTAPDAQQQAVLPTHPDERESFIDSQQQQHHHHQRLSSRSSSTLNPMPARPGLFSLAVHLRSVDRWLGVLCKRATEDCSSSSTPRSSTSSSSPSPTTVSTTTTTTTTTPSPPPETLARTPSDIISSQARTPSDIISSQSAADHDQEHLRIVLPQRFCFVDRVPWSSTPLDVLVPPPWIDRIEFEMGFDWNNNNTAHFCEPLFRNVPHTGRYLLLHLAVDPTALDYHFLLHILPDQVRVLKLPQSLFRQETLYPMLQGSEFGRAWFPHSQLREEHSFARLFEERSHVKVLPLRQGDAHAGALFIDALRLRTKARERRKWQRTLRSGLSAGRKKTRK